MSSKVSCPKCGQGVSGSSLNTWKFGQYDVSRYECKNCRSKFNVYRGAKRTFTIPKAK